MKNFLALSIALLALLSVAASCNEPSSSGSDMLTGLMNAQAQATAAAQQYQNIAGSATTIAQATQQTLILQGQQTRISQDARATETAFTLNVQATQTTAAANSTRQVQIASATEAAQSAFATSTREAERANATATAQVAEYTATANAVIVQATQASASATSTANAANAQATRVSGSATSTVIAAQVLAAQEKADWDRKLESGRAVASFVLGALAIIATLVIVGWGVVRFIDAFVLRARVIKDRTGVPMLVMPPDREGRTTIFLPSRSPGPALTTTPPGIEALRIEAPAADAETTKRDQAISLMIAATSGRGSGSDEVAGALDDGQIEIVDTPPATLLPPAAQDAIDGEWKEVRDD